MPTSSRSREMRKGQKQSYRYVRTYDIVHIMVCLKNFFGKFIGYLSWKGMIFGWMIFFFAFLALSHSHVDYMYVYVALSVHTCTMVVNSDQSDFSI